MQILIFVPAAKIDIVSIRAGWTLREPTRNKEHRYVGTTTVQYSVLQVLSMTQVAILATNRQMNAFRSFSGSVQARTKTANTVFTVNPTLLRCIPPLRYHGRSAIGGTSLVMACCTTIAILSLLNPFTRGLMALMCLTKVTGQANADVKVPSLSCDFSLTHKKSGSDSCRSRRHCLIRRRRPKQNLRMKNLEESYFYRYKLTKALNLQSIHPSSMAIDGFS
jgi:hypothetical protein